jgi:hypothetical protein
MTRIRRYASAAALAAVLVTAAPSAAGAASFNDEYVFVMTKAVNQWNAHPAKAMLYPLTLVADTAFLPFAVIAGFATA